MNQASQVRRRSAALAGFLFVTAMLDGCAGSSGSSDRSPGNERGTAGTRVLAFTGGRWFDGASFNESTVYAVDGVLTFDRPHRVDSTIDLAGRYVVPPFGEAHNHNVEYSPRIESTIQRYLADGVFYVKNPNNLPKARHQLAGLVNTSSSVDVVFANGGLRGPGGHPEMVFRRNLDRGTWTESDGEGAFFFTIANEADIDRKWDAILAGRPDFLKTYLIYSEEYARRRDDPAFSDWKGLDPALLPGIVTRAHRAGLRVSTHVETAADFHGALAAGVDEVNHLPGFRGDADTRLPDPTVFHISAEDARLAARRGTVVVTTVSGALGIEPAGPDSLVRRALDSLHIRNLRLLRQHGVRLAIGSDEYGGTSLDEAMYLHGLGIMDNLALLKLWAEATPQAIFPERKVGCLREGCEASFLVLRGNPLDAFGNVRAIVLRVKDGHILPSPPE